MLEILNRLEFFKHFSSYEKRKTIDMKTQFLVYQENEFLVKEGSSENAFYIIVEGEVRVVKGEEEIELEKFGAGDFFGEIAFLTNTKRTASIVANNLVIVFKIDKELFDHLESETREKFKDYIIKRLLKRLDSLNDLETKEEKHYYKTIHNLRDTNNSYLPDNIQCGIHLFRENYLQPKYYHKKYNVGEKKMLAKKIEKHRGWRERGSRGGAFELRRIRYSIHWMETYQAKNQDYNLGGCMLLVKDNEFEIDNKCLQRAYEYTINYSPWTSGLKLGHTGSLIIEFIRGDIFGKWMTIVAKSYNFAGTGFWYIPNPSPKYTDYFIYCNKPRDSNSVCQLS